MSFGINRYYVNCENHVIVIENNPPSSNKFWRRVLPTTAILFVGTAVVVALAVLKPTPQTAPPKTAPISRVSVVFAKPDNASLSVKSQGTVTPRREIDIVAQVGGKIRRVADKFVAGSFFSAGEQLLEIDPRDYELVLIKAKAKVADSEQLLATEKGRGRQAKKQWRDLGNHEANDLFLRKPQLNSAKANLAAAQADRDRALLDLERTRISVPFAGRVRSKSVDLGQYVTPGTRVAKVYDTSRAEIRLPLTDRQSGLINLPQGDNDPLSTHLPQVTISGTIGGEVYEWQGRVVRTDASIDTNTRLYYAIVEIVEPFLVHPDVAQVPLVVGLFVDAQISGRTIADVIEVPRRALFKNNRIYSVDEQERVLLKHVQVLSTDKEKAWIKGDIQVGEAIIVGGQNFLSSGMKVKPVPLQTHIENTSLRTASTD